VAETAIVVVVPEAASLVDGLRRRYTPDGAAGMPPHVTLLYPFLNGALLTATTEAGIHDAAGSFAPFDVALAATARFERPEDAVLWLRPEPREPFLALTAALVEAFPAQQPYGGAFEEVIPHLTVAVGEPTVLDAIEAELIARLPVRARVEEVALFQLEPGGWRRRESFPLG